MTGTHKPTQPDADTTAPMPAAVVKHAPASPSSPDRCSAHDLLKQIKQREREAALADLEARRAARLRAARVALVEPVPVQHERGHSAARRLQAIDPHGPPLAAPGPVEPPAPLARVQPRHGSILVSFALLVLLPVLVSGWYLWTRATDRYVSYTGFSVRTEEVSSAMELLGGMAALSGSSSSDTDILYRFIQSQEMVAMIDARLNLRAIWARADAATDPVFAFHQPGTIEDMRDYWNRMVHVYNDGGTGLIDLQVEAFAAADAQTIASMIYDESAAMMSRLSAIARADATRQARDERDAAVRRLGSARAALTLFRNRTQIVDPATSIQTQMGLVSSLQFQLAATLIDLDMLRQTTTPNDLRIVQAERRVSIIEARIGDEKAKIGASPGTRDGNAFADLMGEYERLAVDLQFAEQSYMASLVAFDTAVADARRKSRYIAAHVRPTLAQRPEHPRRAALLALVAMFALLIWSITVLSAYALRDRR